MSMTEKPKVAIIGGGRDAGKMLKAQMELLEELESYRAIGTVEELRELKEKAIPKKPAYQGEHEKCPTCGSFHLLNNYCCECGQRVAMDWLDRRKE